MTKVNNYKYYIEKLINHIYEQKLYNISYDLNIICIDKTNIQNIDNLINEICREKIMLDINIEDMITSFIDSSDESYLFRKSIAVEKNYLYPTFYNSSDGSNVKSNFSDSRIILWKHDMDKLYKEDIYSRFKQESFNAFVKANLLRLSDNIVSFVNNKNIENENHSKIIIKCIDKKYLLNSMKEMILDGSLEFEWVDFLVDIDSLRNEMLTYAGDFSIYSEFEKLEDETKYCLDNHCKYNSEELYNILTKDKGFIWKDNIGLCLQ